VPRVSRVVTVVVMFVPGHTQIEHLTRRSWRE